MSPDLPLGTRVDLVNRPAVHLMGVSAGYGALVALDKVSLQVPSGSLMAVVGPNGGGKSTLFRVLLGLLKPSSGTVAVLGTSPAIARRWIGYVPQTDAADWRFPVSVRDVVLMGTYGRLGLLRPPGRKEREAADEAIRLVGLDGLEDRPIGQLSGGQQQRAFLARALVQQPDLLLLDEPMRGVDAPTEHDLYELLALLRSLGRTVIMATHDLSCVAQRFDLVAFLNHRVIASGPPGDVFTETNLKLAYGDHVVMVRVGDRYFAVDAGAHHR